MGTYIWILIAIVAAVAVVALTRARSKNAMNDSEDVEGMEPGAEQTANAGTDGQGRTSSVLRRLSDTGQPDSVRHGALGDGGTDGQGRTSSVLRRLSDTGQPDSVGHATFGDGGADGQEPATSVLRAPETRTMLGTDPSTNGQPYAQLLEDHEMERIRGQWRDIQSEFVDEPRKAVQDADALVAELMQRLAQRFASEREQLESQWADGDDVSTEELRRGLRQYRSFFERLLAA
jgi:hypothetical protein